MHHAICVEVRGELVKIDSLLPPRRFRESNTGSPSGLGASALTC